jgi:hypothetical protein
MSRHDSLAFQWWYVVIARVIVAAVEALFKVKESAVMARTLLS